jgi:hypothetical protein
LFFLPFLADSSSLTFLCLFFPSSVLPLFFILLFLFFFLHSLSKLA